MPIKEIMVKKVITAEPDSTIEHVVQLMAEKNVGSVVIVSEEKPIGIVTDRDIAIRGLGKPKDTKIKEIMTPKVITANENDGFFELTRKFRNYGIRRIVITDDKGYITGIISIDDILEILVTEFANLVGAIRS